MYKLLTIYICCLIQLNAFNVKPINKIEDKKQASRIVAEDGKKIYRPIEVPILTPMQVPIFYAIDDKPKSLKVVKKKTPEKLQPIDKTKYFVDKNKLNAKKVNEETIKIDKGTKFFENLNEKDTTPVDIEK